MNLLIMGPAGSGKGTVSVRIVETYGVKHISTGDMFRAAISNETPVGLEAKSFIDQGALVPDEVTDRMVQERLSQEDVQTHGYLLDGYPRNQAQAKALDLINETLGKPLDAVLNLVVDYDVLVKRITGRRICKDCGAIYHIDSKPSQVEGVCDVCGGELYQRSDDTEAGLKVRYDIYKQETEAVIDYYRNRGIVHDIDGTLDRDAVNAEITRVLESV